MIIAKTKLPPNFSLFLIIGLFNASRQQEQSIGSQLNSCNYGSIVKLSFREDLQGRDWLLSAAIKYRINLAQTCEHIFGSSLQQSQSLKSRSASSSVTLAATARPSRSSKLFQEGGSTQQIHQELQQQTPGTSQAFTLVNDIWRQRYHEELNRTEMYRPLFSRPFSSKNKWIRGEVILHVRRLEPSRCLWKLWLWLWSTRSRTTGPSQVVLMWKQTSTGRFWSVEPIGQSATWNHCVNERNLNCTSFVSLSHLLLPLWLSLKPFQEWNSNYF